MSTTVREYDATALMQIGCGFDSLSGDVKGTAVNGLPSDPIGGDETIFSLFKVESIEDFLSALEITASANIQAGFGKGGAKAKYFRNVKTHSYSTYIAVVVKVRKGTRILMSPKFDVDKVDRLTTPTGQESFRKMYGDEFLAGITSGGEFTALLEIQTSNRTEQEAASASVHGSDAIGANRGSGSFKSFLQEISSKFTLKIYSLQRGGSDPTPPGSPAELVTKALEFPTTVQGDHVYDYLATFQTYDVLERPEGANPIDVKSQQDALEELGLYLLRYQRVVASIEYVMDNPGQFVPFDTASLNAKRNEFNLVINVLRERASLCFGDYEKCEKPIDLSDPVVELPERLSETDRGAVEAAKAAAVEAQGHAVACKGHAARVLEISQTIQPGSDGKALADEAKLETEHAKAAAQLAQDAVKKAIVAGDASPLAAEYVNIAKSAAQQADEAADLASSLLGKIHSTGYSPYWSVPTAILPDRGPTEEGIYEPFRLKYILWNCPNGVELEEHQRALADLTTDPSGGLADVDFVINDHQVISHQAGISLWVCKLANLPDFVESSTRGYIYRSGELPDAAHCNPLHLNIYLRTDMIDKAWGESISFDFLLTSRTTSLSTTFTLTVHFLPDAAEMPRPYLNGNLEVVE